MSGQPFCHLLCSAEGLGGPHRHPRFLFDHVPFVPSDNSWSAENRDPCPDTVTPPAGTKSCVLQYWHPFFVEQYVKMVHALASHLAHADYAQKLLGVWQGASRSEAPRGRRRHQRIVR